MGQVLGTPATGWRFGTLGALPRVKIGAGTASPLSRRLRPTSPFRALREGMGVAKLPAVSLTSIRLLVLDCDGVLTDGSVFVDAAGHEWRPFSVVDRKSVV